MRELVDQYGIVVTDIFDEQFALICVDCDRIPHLDLDRILRGVHFLEIARYNSLNDYEHNPRLAILDDGGTCSLRDEVDDWLIISPCVRIMKILETESIPQDSVSIISDTTEVDRFASIFGRFHSETIVRCQSNQIIELIERRLGIDNQLPLIFRESDITKIIESGVWDRYAHPKKYGIGTAGQDCDEELACAALWHHSAIAPACELIHGITMREHDRSATIASLVGLNNEQCNTIHSKALCLI
jgi:hypothetical protein